jgi:hypothetical protein
MITLLKPTRLSKNLPKISKEDEKLQPLYPLTKYIFSEKREGKKRKWRSTSWVHSSGSDWHGLNDSVVTDPSDLMAATDSSSGG